MIDVMPDFDGYPAPHLQGPTENHHALDDEVIVAMNARRAAGAD